MRSTPMTGLRISFTLPPFRTTSIGGGRGVRQSRLHTNRARTGGARTGLDRDLPRTVSDCLAPSLAKKTRQAMITSYFPAGVFHAVQ